MSAPVAGCCDGCGAYLGEHPHRFAVQSDLNTMIRLRVCVRCLDTLTVGVASAVDSALAHVGRVTA